MLGYTQADDSKRAVGYFAKSDSSPTKAPNQQYLVAIVEPQGHKEEVIFLYFEDHHTPKSNTAQEARQRVRSSRYKRCTPWKRRAAFC